MLPSDMALLEDPIFKGLVEKYAADQTAYFKDFSTAYQKLSELGIPQACPACCCRGRACRQLCLAPPPVFGASRCKGDADWVNLDRPFVR